MNDEINRNTRTLIVSFVLAVMVLIPLRFVEVGNGLNENRVLGESMVLPEAKIEAPYNKIELFQSCNLSQDVDAAIAVLRAELGENTTAVEAEKIFNEIERIETSRCR